MHQSRSSNYQSQPQIAVDRALYQFRTCFLAEPNRSHPRREGGGGGCCTSPSAGRHTLLTPRFARRRWSLLTCIGHPALLQQSQLLFSSCSPRDARRARQPCRPPFPEEWGVFLHGYCSFFLRCEVLMDALGWINFNLLRGWTEYVLLWLIKSSLAAETRKITIVNNWRLNICLRARFH